MSDIVYLHTIVSGVYTLLLIDIAGFTFEPREIFLLNVSKLYNIPLLLS